MLKSIRFFGLTSFVLFCSFFSFGQEFKIVEVNYSCGENNNYVPLNKTVDFFISGLNGISPDQVKKITVKGKGIKCTEVKLNQAFSIVCSKPGLVNLSAKIQLTTGEKIYIQNQFDVIDQPQIEVEIAVTSPDSRFMWLNVIDKNTKEVLDPSGFEICLFAFQLYDSLGVLKEDGIYAKNDDYFPSVSLIELPSRFQLNDQLYLNLSIIDKNKQIIYTNGAQIISITKLWN